MELGGRWLGSGWDSAKAPPVPRTQQPWKEKQYAAHGKWDSCLPPVPLSIQFTRRLK